VHGFRAAVTLEGTDGKTKVTFRMTFERAEEYAKVQAFVTEANEQNFDRLEAELARMAGTRTGGPTC
jgi:hypothetical protein